MSAIAGFWSFGGEPASDRCTRMLEAQRAYGSKPAQSATDGFACGRLLHASLPEDSFDRQPLRRGPYVLVADLRLDNRSELASDLRISSSKLATLSDSDVLFEALLKWDEGTVERLVGEFAFSFWNGADQTLLMARDLFGHRPLHYHRAADFFAFASMPSGLHALAGIPKAFDAQGMAEDLALLSINGTGTHFRGIERIRPGHILRVSRRRVSAKQFWKPSRLGTYRATPADYEEGLRAVVDTAVKAQLRGANQQIATQLSGGLDSSIVTASAARLFDPGEVVAFTAAPRKGFKGPLPDATVADESRLAAQTAARYPNVRHIVVNGSDETLVDVMEREFAFMQRPAAGDCNSLWAREIGRQARQRGLSILLVGFAGNFTVSYSGREAWSALLSRGRLLTVLSLGAKLAANGIPVRSLIAQLIGPILPRPLWELACRLCGRPTKLAEYTAVNPRLLEQIEASARSEGVDLVYRPSNDPIQHRLAGLLDDDKGNYFKGMLGEFGLSLRDPLSDKRVVEYCLSVPPDEYVRDGIERSLARRAFADRLPPAITQFHLRGYQAADWYEAVGRDMPLLRQELAAIEQCPAAAEILDTGWLGETLASWPKDGWARRDVILRYRYGLLRGLSAGHFMRQIAGTN